MARGIARIDTDYHRFRHFKTRVDLYQSVLICVLFQFFCTVTTAQSPSAIELFPEISWTFCEGDSNFWRSATVPGCIHKDLLAHDLIEDPFIGTNETKCQWVAGRNWTYQSAPFSIADSILSREVLELVFPGLDTYAEVFLNDKKILTADNAFRKWPADVKGIIRSQNNVIRIEFTSPIAMGKEKLKYRNLPLPGDATRAVTRKPQYQYGWDWGPNLNTMGITAPVEIIAFNSAMIRDFYIRQEKVTPEMAKLTTVLEIEALGSMNATLELQYQSMNSGVYRVPLTAEIVLKKGMNHVEIPLEVDHPELWWCNDWGKQNLYGFYSVLTVNEKRIDEMNIRTGLRTLKLITSKDDGLSFHFELNGEPVFAKGANYIPLTYFPATATRDDYKKLLEKCRDAHINMLRVWGGGIYEHDWFYDLCDEFGIMIWQDFMFACSMYPGDAEFIENVRQEALEQTVRLRNHPCIALWCGNNENSEGWERWGWKDGLSKNQVAAIQNEYDTLFKAVLPVVVRENTATSYWQSSPMFGRGDPKYVNYGDAHDWWVWHDAKPFESFRENVPRFMSEFGFQSFPSMEVLQMMLSGDSLSMTDAGILQHQKHPRGFQLMDEYMKRWYPRSDTCDFLEYAALTQHVQAEGMAMGIIAQRRAMPRCMGTLFWQLNDVWPSFSWSAIDYKMNEKELFTSLKYLYDPVLIVPEQVGDSIAVNVVCDWPKDKVSESLRIRFYSDADLISELTIPVRIVQGKQNLLNLKIPDSKNQVNNVSVELLNDFGFPVHAGYLFLQ